MQTPSLLETATTVWNPRGLVADTHTTPYWNCCCLFWRQKWSHFLMTYYDLRKDEVEPTWSRESPRFYYFEGFSSHAMYSSRGYVEMLYQKFCFLSMLAFSTTLSHVYWKRTVMTVPEALQSFEGTSTIRQSYRPRYVCKVYTLDVKRLNKA